MSDLVWHTGGCHCGRVRFRVQAPVRVVVRGCNCSICTLTGYQHLIVPKDRFELLAGEAELTSYRFNTGVANHLFCRHCGIKSFYVPRSNPDGISVNFRCLLQDGFEAVSFEDFDGRHWEQNAGDLAHLSRPD